MVPLLREVLRAGIIGELRAAGKSIRTIRGRPAGRMRSRQVRPR
jgi:hypothetical protein